MVTPMALLTTALSLIFPFIFYQFCMPMPFRISSLPAGHIAHPGIFTIIEDIIAVDGGGGVKFREEFRPFAPSVLAEAADELVKEAMS